MTDSCPVCNRVPGTPTCACGYDFSTRDPRVAIERLERDARIGNRRWMVGFVALLCMPVTLWLGGLIFAIVALVQLGFSLTCIVQGIARADTANQQLSAAKQLMALPEARLIVRSNQVGPEVQHSQPKAHS